MNRTAHKGSRFVWLLACLGLLLAPATLRAAELTPEVRALPDYFHKGLGHDVPIPEWAKNRNVRFLAEPGHGPAHDVADLMRKGELATPSTGSSKFGAELLGAGEGLSGDSILTYFGGTVQETPHLHLILWGSNWTKAGSSQEVRSEMEKLFSGLDGSGYQGVMTQYFANPRKESESHPVQISGDVIFNSATDVYLDSSVAAPTNVGHGTIYEEIAKAKAAKNWSSELEDQFFVLPAIGSTYQAFFDESYCGYHESVDGSPYTFLFPPGGNPNCLATPKAITSYASHEYAETVTDPFPNTGWSIPVVNKSGTLLGMREISDFCKTQEPKQLSNGAWVQPIKDDYKTIYKADESIHCEVNDPSPPRFNLGDPTVTLGAPGTVTLKGSIDPGSFKPVKYYFERLAEKKWVKIAGGGVLEGPPGEVVVSQEASGADVASAEGYRLVAQIPTNDGYKEETTGRVFSREITSSPGWPAKLCKTTEVPCAASNRYPAGTSLVGKSSAAATFSLVINFTSQEVKCPESSWEATTQTGAGGFVPVSVTSWSFAKCEVKGSGVKEPGCTVSSATQPTAAAIAWRGGSDGEPRAGVKGDGLFGLRVVCPGAVEPLDCTFSFPMRNSLKGGTAPSLQSRIFNSPAAYAKEHQAGPQCSGYLGNFQATYNLNAPKPLYVSPVGSSQPAIAGGIVVAPGESSAKLQGTVDPNGYATAYRFEYVDHASFRESVDAKGLDHGFDNALVQPTVAKEVGAGTTPVAVSQEVGGLAPGTTYHVRISAGNAEDDAYGAPFVFSTVKPPAFQSASGSTGTGDGQFKYLTDVAVDPTDGTVWVTDDDNDRIQHFSASGQFLGKFAGCFDPGALEVEAQGNIYVACSSSHAIKKYSDQGALLKTIASYGTANGQVRFPLDLSLDSEEKLWVADNENDRVEQFDTAGNFVKAVNLSAWARPWGIAVAPDGKIWLAEPNDARISVVDQSGTLVKRFGSEGTGPGQFNRPTGVYIDPHGYVWVSDANNNRVQVFTEGGEYVTQLGQAGTGPGQFKGQGWMRSTVAPNGDVYVTDLGNARLQRWQGSSHGSAFQSASGSTGTGDGQFKYLTDVAVDPTDGTVWVTDDDNDRIQHFSASGQFLGKFAGCFDPGALEVEAQGNIYVACSSSHAIKKYSDQGALLKTIASYGTANGQVRFPLDLSLDSEEKLWVADNENDRVEQFDTAGNFVKAVNLSAWARPWGIAVAPDGKIWLAEPNDARISVVDQSGTLVKRFGSEGTGPGQFNRPTGVYIDPHGYVWVSDANNNRVQVFTEGGEYVTQLGQAGTGPGQFKGQGWMRSTVAPNGDVYVTDLGNARLQRWGELIGWTL